MRRGVQGTHPPFTRDPQHAVKGGSLSLAWGGESLLFGSRGAWVIGQLVTLVQMPAFYKLHVAPVLLGLQSNGTIKQRDLMQRGCIYIDVRVVISDDMYPNSNPLSLTQCDENS